MDLQRTPLFAAHRQLRARMAPFGGWEMPIEYSGILAEHMAVRRQAGLFDVSHMGEITVRGPKALDLVQHVCCNDAARLKIGQAQYSGLMTESGTFVDDLLVHKVTDTEYLLVVNAGNQSADFEHIQQHNPMRAEVHNAGPEFAQLALQGPRALEILKPLTPFPAATIPYYWFTRDSVLGIPAWIARTGYTGEDGFEIYCAPSDAETLWFGLLEKGRAAGLIPCGLGARNTLRLEAAMPLYGHEIDLHTIPREARLGWICKLSKGDFLGSAVLKQAQAQPLKRLLYGLRMLEPGIARDGYPVLHNGQAIGQVTSGAPAPALGANIALAWLPPEFKSGQEVEVQVRQRSLRAGIVELPFYRRAHAA